MTERITILGSTGSIGVSTLEVVRANPGRLELHALTANGNVEALRMQCIEFRPAFAVMRDAEAAGRLAEALRRDGCETEVLSGDEGLEQVAAGETDLVMAAIVGGAGLGPTIAAAAAGKRLLLANKEALVMAGRVFMDTVERSGAVLLPIDSEHNAIYQCLANGAPGHALGVSKICLTASGGPLLRTDPAALEAVTPAEACAHPNWDMGRKISVDSATMMNKGLELIEACWLFDIGQEDVEIVVHPQSIVHSMVSYRDGSVVAELGNPDMRTPIAHALAWPDRIDSGVAPLDLAAIGRLDFEPADTSRFPCLELAREAARGQQSAAIALNAANEVAVEAFLDELIRFTEIPLIIEHVLGQTWADEANTMEAVLAIDDASRRKALEFLAELDR